MKKLALIAVLGVFSYSAVAQAPAIRGDETKQQANCPPSKPNDAQSIEQSVILPSAGGENSAAATTQRHGETVVASPDCAQPKK